MLLELQNLGKSFGEHEVLRDVNAGVERGDRIGIIGANGTGKTTLLRILCGESLPDAGDAAFGTGVTTGYLEQNARLDPSLDIYATMRLVFTPALDAMQEMDALQKQLAADPHNAELTEKIAHCTAVIDAMDAYNMDTQIKKVLNGMGFPADTLDSVCITFDKMDKIGAEGVKAELTEKQLPEAAINALADFIAAGDVTLESVASRCADPAIADDLKYVLATAKAMANGRFDVAYCPSLVRGQGYYTGMVFEITCPQFSGAVAGGGRYDNMIGKFLGTKVPAVGFSIGFERVCGILLEQGYQIPGAKQKIALLYNSDVDFPAVLAKAAQLRDTYNVTVLPQAKKLGKQLGQLEAAGFAGAAFMDKDEVKVFAAQ